MKKRGMCLLLVILILLTQIPLALAVTASGKCGDNLTWTLDDSGTLTINGTGDMYHISGWQMNSMTQKDIENFAPWYDYRDKIRKVSIGVGVTRIADWAFFNCDSMTSITFSESVTDIGYKTFYSCDNLTSITIPSNVAQIDWEVFLSCQNLKTIAIPASVTSIGSNAFASCDNLTTVYYQGSQEQWESVFGRDQLSKATIRYNSSQSATDNISETLIIPAKDIHGARCGNNLTWKLDNDTLTIHGTGAMYDFSLLDEAPWHYLRDNIAKVAVDNTVTSIGSEAFCNCDKLTSVIIPDSITSVCTRAFRDCDELMSIIIPNSVTDIGDSAFYSCDNLTSITLPNSIVNIGDCVFAHCEKLTNVTIPSNITSIGEYAFLNSGMTSAIIPDKVTVIGRSAFSQCDNLKTVIIPGSVKTMGVEAFAHCPSLTNVTILNGVTVIGDMAFRKCENLTSVTLPESITNIERGAFEDCGKLTDVYYGGSPGGNSHQWDAIVGNAALKSANIHYNSANPNGEPVTPTPVEPAPQANNDISKYSYAFGNDAKSFGYRSDYKIPLASFQLIFVSDKRSVPTPAQVNVS